MKQLIVNMTNGKTLLLKVSRESTVDNIKINIEQREGIPRHLQKFRLGFKYLNNDYELNTLWKKSRITSLELKLAINGGMLGQG